MTTMPKEQMTIRLYPETRRRMDSWLEESNSKGSSRSGYRRYYFPVALYPESVSQSTGYGLPCIIPDYYHFFYRNDRRK